MYIHIHIYTYIHIYIVCVYTHIYIVSYIYIYTHTYTHLEIIPASKYILCTRTHTDNKDLRFNLYENFLLNLKLHFQ